MKNLRSALATMTMLFGITAVLGPSMAAEEITPPKPKAVSEESSWSAQVAPDGESTITLGEQQNITVGKISEYFSKLTTLNGRFIQTGADKKVMKGKFKMMRPGKFRFDYARPSLQVIISDGRYLAIQDHDLGNENRISLDQTPFRILLRKDVDLARDADILEVQETDNKIYLVIRDKSPDSPGVIKLTFTKEPQIELSQWITTDAQGLDTHVEVKNLVHGEKFNDKEFVITAPEQRFIR